MFAAAGSEPFILLPRACGCGYKRAMKGLRQCILSVVFPLIFFGCAVSNVARVPGPIYPPTIAENVAILYQQPSRPYDVIGFVAVDVGRGAADKDTNILFRRGAAEMGADAVIVRSIPQPGFVSFVQGRGEAIRWRR